MHKAVANTTVAGGRLRRWRAKQRLSLIQAAQTIGGTSPASLGNYEHGRKVPSVLVALQICKVVGIPLKTWAEVERT